MGALNNGVVERCGRVRGVIHEMWIVDKSEHPEIKDLRVVGGEGLQVRRAGSSKKTPVSCRRGQDMDTRVYFLGGGGISETRQGRKNASPPDAGTPGGCENLPLTPVQKVQGFLPVRNKST